MRTLDEVLKDLKEAEKEFSDKCLTYGITEKTVRKKKENIEEKEDNPQEENN